MRQFFDNLKTLDDIQSLIEASERESEVLEYKECLSVFTNEAKNEIAKDVSAMANSGGGVIVYGVRTDQVDRTRPVAIEGLDLKNIETFQRVLNSRIRPPIKGTVTKPLPPEHPRLMVVYVPESDDKPHQNMVDKKYYRRSGTESIPMEHDLVALHFGRTLGPILSLRFQPDSRPQSFGGDPSFSNQSRLRILVENSGKRIGRFVEVLLLFPPLAHMKILTHNINLANIDPLYPGRQARQFTENVGVFHPGMVKSIVELDLSLSAQLVTYHSDEPFVDWTIFSDNMNPTQGFVTLRQLGWATKAI